MSLSGPWRRLQPPLVSAAGWDGSSVGR